MTIRRLSRGFEVWSPDEGVEIIPFSFVINGTSQPDGLAGDSLETMTRNSAGNFTGQLRDKPAVCFGGFASISSTTAVDIYGKVDWSSVATNGSFTVRCMTGAVETDPADNVLVSGFLLVKKTTRKAHRA